MESMIGIDNVVACSIGNRESVKVALKGFYWGKYIVFITMVDEPGNRRVVVNLDGQQIEKLLPEPLKTLADYV